MDKFFKTLTVTALLALSCRLADCLETASPEKFLPPRNYNPHPYAKKARDEDAVASRFVEQLVNIQNVRQGPVLFPNIDAPPPTNRPLIVTSRPLAEQIARVSQKPTILTPSAGSSTDNNPQISAKDYQNTILNRVQNLVNQNGYLYQRDYQNLNDQYDNQRSQQFPNSVYVVPAGYNLVDSYGNIRNDAYDNLNPGANAGYVDLNGYQVGVNNVTTLDQNPYAGVLKKLQQFSTSTQRPRYDAIEEQTVVPTLYNALGKYAKTKALKGDGRRKTNVVYRQPEETNTVENHGADDEYYNDDVNNGNKHYAFSYSVKDHQTGDDFSHSQRQTGTGTNGEYRVKLPDGRTQIVSYTADNGGYKAEVRYEEDSEAETQKTVKQKQPTYAPLTNRWNQNTQSKLGRIVVPSQEETDYQDLYYYEQNPSKTQDQRYNNYVTNDAKEVLITSRPGFLQTPSTTQSNLLYSQYDYNQNDAFTVTPRDVVYIRPTSSSLVRNNAFTTTNNPQDTSRTYSHFYDAESVKFVSTTPKYPPILKNSIASNNRYTSTTASPSVSHFVNRVNQDGYLPLSSTVAPGLDNYDHLDSPDVVKIEPRPKTTVRYTSLAPLLYNSVANSQSTVAPTAVYQQSDANPTKSNILKLAQYVGGGTNIDLRKYFTFKKR